MMCSRCGGSIEARHSPLYGWSHHCRTCENEPKPCDYCGKTAPTGHSRCRDYDRADEEMRDQERRERDEVTSDE